MKKKLVFLTGASISAEASISAFRDAVTAGMKELISKLKENG